ncbi:hypothetical protein BD311DRAFT_771915 [Dichomitus squalens]|uniref:Uncharacterized protein n=1 Tax=Dichomitus squalens TaxID=114155 RepID=A0A4Q9M670_9APHY|nr:hypothetical protein BD311DRAFT_771915 [Dichomitus squalens]
MQHTYQGLFRGGMKSTPESANLSEDEDSSDDEDGPAPFPQDGPGGTPHMTGDEMVMSPDGRRRKSRCRYLTCSMTRSPSLTSFLASLLLELTDSLQTWSPEIDTLVHSNMWSTATNAASPTLSHLSATDYFSVPATKQVRAATKQVRAHDRQVCVGTSGLAARNSVPRALIE